MTATLKKILSISLLICISIFQIQAQFISKGELRRNDVKTTENRFKVSMSEDENPLNFRIKVDNPTKEPVRAYLRKKNESIFLEEQTISSDLKVVVKLELGLLADGQYIFVVKNNNGFFIKHINLESGDLLNARIGGKEVMTIGRTVILTDE
jgi:hypothetical protein